MAAFSATPALFASQAYDYVIAGGGTAGLTLAARLTENPNVSVAVIEAGGDRSHDDVVLVPGLTAGQFNNPDYDWNFLTPPQPGLKNRQLALPRGKQLGGSSALTYLFFTHPSKADIDDWEALGNPGWNFANLFPYFKKSEHYIPPFDNTSKELNLSFFDPALHGTSGPIQNSFSNSFFDYGPKWIPTFEGLGLAAQGDPKDGETLGGYINLNNIDARNVTRSYAANGYLNPILDRPNLHVLPHALVSKVLFAEKREARKRDAELTANGLAVTAGSQSYVIEAKKEVILSAGSIQSPQLLELSGIGDRELLEKYGIDVVIDNPNVGENLQDHIYAPTAYMANPDQFTSPVNATEALALYKANRTGPLAGSLAAAALLSYDQLLLDPSQGGKEPPGIHDDLCTEECRAGLSKQLELTRRKALNPKVAAVQHLASGGRVHPELAYDTVKLLVNNDTGAFFGITGGIEHPFSRGFVHINSSNPTDPPVIDPKYLSHPLDIEILAAAVLNAQKIAQSPPLSDSLQDGGTVYPPGFYRLTAENAKEFVRDNVLSEYHQLGTCAMLPREEGGVVDSRLKVYGTANLRVVDAGVIPLMVESNLQSTVYAVAERAADVIKGKI